jgi:AraC family transcriptional regulator of adaptative response/methylated-DNA-[protein]-cysteine methyltransferase
VIRKNILSFAVRQSSLGQVLVGATDIGVCFIALGDQPDNLINDLQNAFPESNLISNPGKLDLFLKKIIQFLERPVSNLDLPLDISGSVFQQKVWLALRDIPFGKTVSYSELAKIMGMPKSTRAVARACASNRIALAIPCHRVICSNGITSGYRWGAERKKILLERERKNLA